MPPPPPLIAATSGAAMEMDGEAMDIDSSAAQNQQATKTTSNSDSNGVGTKKGTRLVIANAHLHWDPMFQDVKLWQMHRVLLHVRREHRRRLVGHRSTTHTDTAPDCFFF